MNEETLSSPKYSINDILITYDGTPFFVTRVDKYENGKYYYSSIPSKLYGIPEAGLYDTLESFIDFFTKLTRDKLNTFKELQ